MAICFHVLEFHQEVDRSGLKSGACRYVLGQPIDLIDRRPFLLADGRTPADVRKLQTTLNDLVILLQALGPLAEHVEDSIRQYQVELYVTVLNAYATAGRVQGDAQVEIFAKDMEKQLAIGPRTPRMVTGTPVAVTIRIPTAPPATEE